MERRCRFRLSNSFFLTMWRFLLPSAVLAIFGLFTLAGTKPELLQNQIIFLLIGFIVYFVIRLIGVQFFRVNTYLLYGIFLLLLIATLIFGEDINGSRRWIDLYFFNFQTSEIFKVFYILILSDYLARSHRYLKEPVPFVILLFSFLIPAMLIFMQPDLETALFLAMIFLVITVFSAVPKNYLATLIGSVVLLMPIAWFFLAEYQRNRIMSFINPQLDPQGTAYNMTQSIITIGSGQFAGRGLGGGKQSTLFFLPENHTDFAFASLVEQFGFLGGFVVLLLYATIAAVLILLIIKYMHNLHSNNEETRFRFYFTIGFLSYFLFQVFVNIGMNLGILPISGTALPLISYGGSSLVTWMIGLGFVSQKT